MGKFSRLLQAKGKDVTIGDEVYNIKPLTGKHMGLFMSSEGDNQAEALFNLVLVSLQQTDATLTIEDIQELPMGVLTEVFNVVSEVNELK